VKKILLTTTALHQPWNVGDWDMTDGNTYAINKHLDKREDYDALQEVTTGLEQAEARIEELEKELAGARADWFQMVFRAIDLKKEVSTTLAELKGQDDE
jgi:F0F1-type ATP synthase membrane subunit b/b'